MIKSYSELMQIESFGDRLEALQQVSKVGEKTFGEDRYLNQAFYTSAPYKQRRLEVIARDKGCDLGIDELEITGPIYVHHIVPITAEDIYDGNSKLLDPENLICCSFNTHQQIHFKTKPEEIIERSAGDHIPW